jgi:rare lipoprotein A
MEIGIRLQNISLSLAAILLSFPTLNASRAEAVATPKNFSGNVSWYGVPFHGKKTASGKIFDMNKCTSAHLKLPFFTKVLVEDPKNGKSVVVQVLDRGPYVKTRVMDLSREAAKRLGTLGSGVAYVDCTVINENDDDDTAPAKAAPAAKSSAPAADKKEVQTASTDKKATVAADKKDDAKNEKKDDKKEEKKEASK